MTYTVTLQMPSGEHYVHDGATYLRKLDAHALCRVQRNGSRVYMVRVHGADNPDTAAAYGLNEIQQIWGVSVPGWEGRAA